MAKLLITFFVFLTGFSPENDKNKILVQGNSTEESKYFFSVSKKEIKIDSISIVSLNGTQVGVTPKWVQVGSTEDFNFLVNKDSLTSPANHSIKFFYKRKVVSVHVVKTYNIYSEVEYIFYERKKG